ncbi:MAG: RdgB/HAM1 family non-canonical purine NTP pyrophosphatase [Bacteroidales bacterium]|nr:RdgB/HAM1 family non-canonical purine NTP pyrophosphatase [Bacteroidales bacterium]
MDNTKKYAELVFATNNKHKLQEVRAALDGQLRVVGLEEVGLQGEIPETADTLEGNALQKAMWVWQRMHATCFADDTGLEVDALGGAPGVYSARYAGEHCSFDDNIDKLLSALAGKDNRKARFRTVICLIEPTGDDAHPMISYHTGQVEGLILTERHTAGEGFGYDPVFMPDRFAVSFAEMPLEVKNRISHRACAVRELTDYLTHSKR